MNKRILELAIQSGLPTALDYHQKRYEKFAELIVQECIDVIGEDNYTMLTGKAYCTELKRHFGI